MSRLIALEHGSRGRGVKVTLFRNITQTSAPDETWMLFEFPRNLRTLVANDRLDNNESGRLLSHPVEQRGKV